MRLYALSILPVLLFGTGGMRGQTSVPASSVPNSVPLCKPADIDTTFDFADVPDGHQTIGIRLHNRTLRACRLRGELAPDFVADAQDVLIHTCWLCKPDGSPDREAIERNDNFILSGDGDTQVTYRWSSVGDACKRIDWASIGVEWDGRASFLFENMHWKPNVCSTLQISGYESGATATPRWIPGTEGVLKVSAPPDLIYADEFVRLTLTLHSIDGSAAPTGRCPELYGSYHDSNGSARFEAILPDGYNALVREPSEQPSLFISGYSDSLPAEFNGYRRVCDFAGTSTKTTVTLPASLEAAVPVMPEPNLRDLRHIVWRAENPSMHEPLFVSADVHFQVLDPDTLPQNWGPEVAGIGAGLSVDKTTFTAGDTIPLHLRWENFSASTQIGVDECGNPQPQVEIQDALHHVVGTADFRDLCNGHGWGPFSVTPGKPHRSFARLRYWKTGYVDSDGKAVIPGPGTYYLSAVWSPPRLMAKGSGSAPVLPGSQYLGERYATARSQPVRIEILPRMPNP